MTEIQGLPGGVLLSSQGAENEALQRTEERQGQPGTPASAMDAARRAGRASQRRGCFSKALKDREFLGRQREGQCRQWDWSV